MSFSNGTFTLVAGNPVVTATTISSTTHNNTMSDIATGLSTCVLKDGTQTMTGNIPMSSFKFTGLGAGTARTDAASLATIQDGTGVYVATVGGTSDAITLTASPAITAYAAGQTFRWIASGANTTSVTLAVSGLASPKAITKNGTTALAAGDIPSGMMVEATYDGTRFILGAVASVPLSLFTTAGDIVQATGATAVARLGIGTARQVPFVNAGATALAYLNPITIATEQASTSGTSIDFSSIPAGVRRITVMFVGVSTSGSSNIMIQLGDPTPETSGYLSGAVESNTSGNTSAEATTGFLLTGATALGNAQYGQIILSLEKSSNFTWTSSGVLYRTTTTLNTSAGEKATSAEMTVVRITTANGSDTFDAGLISISYE